LREKGRDRERQSKVSEAVKDDDMQQEWMSSTWRWWGLILPGCRQAPPRPALCTAREYHVQPLFVFVRSYFHLGCHWSVPVVTRCTFTWTKFIFCIRVRPSIWACCYIYTQKNLDGPFSIRLY
jgi:hypothetical protein